MSAETRYREFLLRLQPAAVALESCAASIDREGLFRLRKTAGSKGLERRLEVEYRLGNIGKDYFDVIGELCVTTESAAGEPSPLTIKCQFAVHLHGLLEKEEDLADQLAQSEARLFLWP